MYMKYSHLENSLKPHDHINLDAEFREDCQVWLTFLDNDKVLHRLCRPLIDFCQETQAQVLNFYTDSSANRTLGFGGIFCNEYFLHRWEEGYIEKFSPSIEYLELYAVCMGLFIWERKLKKFNNYWSL